MEAVSTKAEEQTHPDSVDLLKHCIFDDALFCRTYACADA